MRTKSIQNAPQIKTRLAGKASVSSAWISGTFDEWEDPPAVAKLERAAQAVLRWLGPAVPSLA